MRHWPQAMPEPIKRSPPRSPQVPGRKDPGESQPWRVEGGREPSGQSGGRGPRFRFPRWLLWLTLGLLLLNILVARQVPDNGGRLSVPYSFFLTELNSGNVTKVNAQGEIVQGTFKTP